MFQGQAADAAAAGGGSADVTMTFRPDWFDSVLTWTSLVIEMAGVVAVIVGGLLACVLAIGVLRRRGAHDEAYRVFRTSLARSILLGLEFLVAADIIGTVAVQPTLQNLYVLGLIVLIRTFLSFSLELEIDGRWPWQKRKDPNPKDET